MSKNSIEEICITVKNSINLASSAKIFFVNPDYNPSNEGDYPIARLNINNSVVKATKSIIRGFMADISDRKPIPISKLDKEDKDYVLTIPLAEVESLNKYISMIKANKYKTFHAHNCEAYLDNLKYYIIQIKINNTDYYFIKKYSVNKLLTPKRVMLVYKENTFEHIDNKDIFTLENSLDAFVKDDTIYVANETPFSQMTGYYEKEKTKAKELLNEIKQIGILADFEGLKNHCEERISYMKRLSKVDKGALSKLDFDKIIALQKKRGTQFVVDMKNRKISYGNTEQLNNILDIVLDNFVTSSITNEEYRALNKYKDAKPEKTAKAK